MDSPTCNEAVDLKVVSMLPSFNSSMDEFLLERKIHYEDLDYSTSSATSSELSGHVAESITPVIGTLVNDEEHFQLYIAILLLYRDQIKPQLIEIQYRLAELSSSLYLQRHCIHLYQIESHLYTVESTTPDMHTWTVLLKKIPEWFNGWVQLCDVCDDQFPYHVWVEFYNLIIGLQTSSGVFDSFTSHIDTSLYRESCNSHQTADQLLNLPYFALNEQYSLCYEHMNHAQINERRARYELSRYLKLYGPPSLQEYSLGQLNQFVHLAVLHGILVYSGVHAVPISACMSYIRSSITEQLHAPSCKAQCLESIAFPSNQESVLEDQLKLAIKPRGSVMTVLTEIHWALQKLLSDPTFKPMLLSQFKLRFHDMFHQHLDTLIFGHSTLSDFLKKKCSQYCRLIRDGRHVYIDRITPVVPPPPLEQTQATLQSYDPVDNLIRLLARHYRFHSNLTFAFWQDAFGRQLEATSIEKSLSAQFCDYLFSTILRPALDLPNSATDSEVTQTGSKLEPFAYQMSHLKWFTRQSFIERKLIFNGRRQLNDTDISMLHSPACSVLLPTCFRKHHVSCDDMTKDCISRPSRLRRQITAQLSKLNQEFFS